MVQSRQSMESCDFSQSFNLRASTSYNRFNTDDKHKLRDCLSWSSFKPIRLNSSYSLSSSSSSNLNQRSHLKTQGSPTSLQLKKKTDVRRSDSVSSDVSPSSSISLPIKT